MSDFNTPELSSESDEMLKRIYEELVDSMSKSEDPVTKSYGTIYKAFGEIHHSLEKILTIVIFEGNNKLSIKTAEYLLLVQVGLSSYLEQMQQQQK